MPEYGIDPGDSEYLTPYPQVSDEQKIVAFDDILDYILESGAHAADVTGMAMTLAQITHYYAELLGAM